jgi:predicted O-methyltransferase YrrM
VIVVDNVVRKGGVVDPNNADANVQGVRRFYDAIAKDNARQRDRDADVGSKGTTASRSRGYAC